MFVAVAPVGDAVLFEATTAAAALPATTTSVVAEMMMWLRMKAMGTASQAGTVMFTVVERRLIVLVTVAPALAWMIAASAPARTTRS